METVLNAREIEQRLRELESRGVTVAIVDTPSGLSAASTAAIRHSDLCMIPARPSIADIEASALTLSVVRAWKKPFAFILNQTPIRGNRIGSAATTLSDDAGFDLADVVAKPFIVMRNDHQDALAAGLSVGEYDSQGKSAEEISSLWRWTETRLNYGVVEAMDRRVRQRRGNFRFCCASASRLRCRQPAGHALAAQTGAKVTRRGGLKLEPRLTSGISGTRRSSGHSG